MFVLLLRGCIIADFFFRGKRVVGGNVRPCWGCCLVCGFVGRTLARRVLSGDDSAGGVLILGWRKSALFFKSSLFERSEFGLLENAFSRFPAA